MSKIRKIVIIIQILALMVMTSCSNNDNKKIIEDSTYVEIDSIDYGLEMTEITIEIPGLEYERTYLYMADNQANFDNTIEDLGWFGSSTNRVFCDENGISAADNIDNWINFANDSKVDYMLMGGDIIDFYSQENIDILKSELSKLEVPYLYTYGNHDSYVPWENKFDDDAEDFNELFHYGNREIQVIDEGDYYIVAVRNYSVDGTAQISDIALNEFLKVYEQQKPIILICHVPIYTAYTNGLYETTVNAFGHIFMKYDAGEFGTVDAALLMGG